MSQLQRYSIILLLFSVILCFVILNDSTFNVGITPFILICFVVCSLAFFYWISFTNKGNNFALKYEKQTSSKYTSKGLKSSQNLIFLGLVS